MPACGGVSVVIDLLQSPPWTLFTDGSSTTEGSGAGLVILSPDGEKFEYAIKFAFYASNNESEHEVFILGLHLCLTIDVKSLQVKSDSQLIAGQISKEFEVKEDNMKSYFDKHYNKKSF